MKKISICVPCYNEQGNVNEMYTVLTDIMSNINDYTYEIIFEDNSSTDETQNILRNIAFNDKRVKVILNNRNFGPMANSAYIVYQATGDAIIGLPCDFQEPPEMIPSFIEQWEKGYKVVLGQKTRSEENTFIYLLRSLYYKIMKSFSKVDELEHVTGFGIFDREVIDMIESLKEPEPNFRNLVVQLGYEIKLLPYEQKQRRSGKSGYSFFSYLNLAIHSFINVASSSMRIITITGTICTFISFLLILGACILQLFKIVDFMSLPIFLLLILILLGSITIFSLGLLGEYLISLFTYVKQYPLVVEKERINFND